MALTFGPKLLALGSSKKILSSDPYAVDSKYLRALFDPYDLYGVPKNLLDPLGTMRSNYDYSITTGSGGNCIVVICPFMMPFGPPVINTTTAWYPFVSVSSSNTNLVYNGSTNYSGPFNGQQANIIGFYPDQCKVSFQCSQSILNASGRIFCGVFYDNPNQSFALGQTGTFDATLTSITPT